MDRIAVTVYTDGACKGNPGPGGWAAILTHPAKEIILRGGEPKTTNNRMELTAVIKAVKELKAPCEITIVTDSTYVMMTKDRWNRFTTNPRLKNRDLWAELYTSLTEGHHKIHYQKVQGHSGHVMNERCDRVAKEQSVKYSHIAAGTNTPTINEAIRILAERG